MKSPELKVELLCIIDESGSMQSMVKEVIGGFNAFLKDQKAVPGEAKITLVKFDHEYMPQYEGVNLDMARDLTDATYCPRGTTALRDAVGRTLDKQGERIAKEGWADKVIVTIITDGYENASKDYSTERIKEMTAHAEKHGWHFIYLGANQDSWATAATLGINANALSNSVKTFAYTSAGVTASMASASLDTTNYRTHKPVAKQSTDDLLGGKQ